MYLRTAAFVSGLLLCAGAHCATPYPTRSVKLILPFAAGAGADSATRVVARKLGELWQQPVVIDNRPGAAGPAVAAQAAPDGYTLMVGAGSTMVTAPMFNKRLPYNTQRDFVPVGRLVTNSYVFLANPQTGIKSIAQLIARAKEKPATINFGSAGVGSPSHLIMEMFEGQTGTELFHIAYKSGAPVVNDLMAGQVQVGLNAIPSVTTQIKGGNLTALAVTSAKRDPLLPNVPTMEEAGIKDFRYTLWYGVFAPAKTPAEIVAKVSTDLQTVLNDPEVRRELAEQGALADPDTPAQFTDLIKSESAKWAKLIKDRNIQID